jgi:hypothetical protein
MRYSVGFTVPTVHASSFPWLPLGNALPRGFCLLVSKRDVRESLVVHSIKSSASLREPTRNAIEGLQNSLSMIESFSIERYRRQSLEVVRNKAERNKAEPSGG